MAKKQTRRSVSLNRQTYEQLRKYCEINQLSMSQFVEARIADFIGRAPAATPSPAPVLVPKPAPVVVAAPAHVPVPAAKVPSAAILGARPSIKPPARANDEVAARRAAERIFTF